MAEYTLYCFAQSGNAYKAALMLNACGADWEPRFVDFFNGETRTEEYRRDVNVMGEAPVLIHGDEKLTQSGNILYYLVDQFGKYGPETKAEEREILRWILFDNHKLTSYTGTVRFLRTFLKTGETPVDGVPGRAFARRARGARPASGGQRLRGRRAADHRRHFHVRLHVLRRRDRRRLGRLPQCARLARPHQAVAQLATPLRADAGPSVAGIDAVARPRASFDHTEPLDRRFASVGKARFAPWSG